MKAIVIGAGIGGLSAAVALRRAGVEVEVFERAWELREIGAAISLWANAMKAAKGLGVYGEIRKVAWPPPGAADGRMEVRSQGGRLLFEIPGAALERRFGEASVALTRPDLQRILLGALRETGGEIQLGSTLASFEQDGRGALARFADGQEERADLLVGADGLRSTVRERLLGDGPPLYAGSVAWRAMVETEKDPTPGKAGFFALGPGAQFGLLKLLDGRQYWFVGVNAPEVTVNGRGGAREELLDRLGSWHAPIPEVIAGTEEESIHRDGVYHREPATRWGSGRVTLLGDAAHPMTPDLGQGACQAIEDAVVLARCVSGTNDIEAALRLYETRRIERTSVVVRKSLRESRTLQGDSPLWFRVRNAALWALPAHLLLNLQMKGLDPIVGQEP